VDVHLINDLLVSIAMFPGCVNSGKHGNFYIVKRKIQWRTTPFSKSTLVSKQIVEKPTEMDAGTF
jgi:hypothetical protein